MQISGFYINSVTDPFVHDFKLTNDGGFHFETQGELGLFKSRLCYAFAQYMNSAVVVETFEERQAKKALTNFEFTCGEGEKLDSHGDCVPNEPLI